jgi:hypothetical protein
MRRSDATSAAHSGQLAGDVVERGEDLWSEESERQGPEPQRGRVELAAGQPGDALAGLGSNAQPFPLTELVGDGLGRAAQVESGVDHDPHGAEGLGDEEPQTGGGRELVIGLVGGPPGLLQVPCRPGVDPRQRRRLGGQSTKVAAVGAGTRPSMATSRCARTPAPWRPLSRPTRSAAA